MIRFRHIFLLCALSALAVGCSGDDGAPGPQGPQGPQGPTGGQGPTGSPGGVPITSAEKINVEINSVSAAAGVRPQVELFLSNDLGQGLTGLPAGNIRFIISQLTPGANGSSSEWQSYTARDDGGVVNAQATTETPNPVDFTDNGDGSYTYTFANALDAYPAGPAFDATKLHRLGIEIRTSSNEFLPENIPANNAPYDFRPDGGTLPTDLRAIVDNDTCNACHDNLEAHGEARFDVGYCVMCHNPSSVDGQSVNLPWGGSVDMKVMIHKIHYGEKLLNGYSIEGRSGRDDYSEIVFPQDVRNCTTCHDTSDLASTPQAVNYYEVVNRESCGTCHDNILDWSSQVTGHPNGLAFNDDEQCLDCHGPTSTVNNGELQVREVHKLLDQEASGNFAFNILAIDNVVVGQPPEVTFSVTNPVTGLPYDLATAPEFGACADGTSRLAVNIAWTSDDYTNTGSDRVVAQPVTINPLIAAGCGGTATDNNDGTYTVTSPIPLPAVAGAVGVALEGHPWSDLNGDGLSGRSERIAVTNAVDYAGIGGAAATPRRNAVAIEKCDDCHNQLAMHGNNRTDEPEACVMCHNPNATDASQRLNQAGACFQATGDVDSSIDMKYMIHAIHRGEEANYSACGFGGSFNSFAEVVYPGRLNNCEGCHEENAYYPVEPGEILGTTIEAGNDLAAPTDDIVVSPNTAACSGCHVTALAAEHMKQNGGDFDARKAADSSLISAGVETCALCHGPGRTADVKVVHKIDEFRFN